MWELCINRVVISTQV
uniref:Uncharacterized protein n=1 Tax=Anguilla anguilla TaxID=7936 RepID=A0A0E9U1Z7_ANGAN